MTHDPMQTLATLGAYQGVATPYGLPQTAFQTTGINPLLQGYSQLGQQGYGAVPYGGINPQQQQQYNPWQQNPYLQHQLGIGIQNPLVAAGLQNPLLQQNPFVQQNPLLQNPLVNPIQAQIHAQIVAQQVAQQLAAQQVAQQLAAQQVAQQLAQQQQLGLQPYGVHVPGMISPVGHLGAQFGQSGFPLAPQTWVGQGAQFGGGIGYGQVHPLAHLAGRGLQAGGFSPWGI